MGFEQAFWRVRIRPGSPFSFGFLVDGDRRVPVFGLPGNPASAYVTFELFVRPALLRLGGHRRVLRRTIRARAGEALRTKENKAYFLRVSLVGHGIPTARATGPQGSGLVRGLGAVDGLAVVPEGVETVAAGDDVEVILLDDGPGAVPWDPAIGR
jgi:molybdopterin molybdotransferase